MEDDAEWEVVTDQGSVKFERVGGSFRITVDGPYNTSSLTFAKGREKKELRATMQEVLTDGL